jgi:ubiquinone/menaquinone biosynthesis C-methylase UbiE
MTTIPDRQYLKTEQYRDSSNLNARIQLHERFSTNPYGWQRWVFDQLDIPLGSRVLELGCGPGNLWAENISRVRDDWHISLSDFSQGMVREARQRLATNGKRFNFLVTDAQSLPFPDESFDVVLANHMLYYVTDRPQAFADIRRVLKRGGRFYATTVGATHMRDLDLLAERFDPTISNRGGHSTSAFELENGTQQLEPWFSDVEMRRYEDSLVVTEAEPIVACVISVVFHSNLSDRRAEFTRFVQSELDRGGALHIHKDSGIFIAGKV